MKREIGHREIAGLLHVLRKRELTAEEWAVLDMAALDDPFLAEALEGLRLVSTETRKRHLNAILKKLPAARKPRRYLAFRIAAAAASVTLIVATVFLLRESGSRETTGMAYVPDPEVHSGDTQAALHFSAPDVAGNSRQDLIEKEPENTNAIVRSSPQAKPSVSPELRHTDREQAVPESSPPAGEAESAMRRPMMDADATLIQADETFQGQQMDFVAGRVAIKPAERNDKKVSGVVLDDKGTPVENAHVQLKGTRHETLTDTSGNFSVDVPPLTQAPALIISHAGFQSKEAPITDDDRLVVQLNSISPENADSKTPVLSEHTETMPLVRALAQPVAGMKSYQKYLDKNLRYPEVAAQQRVHGTVILEFQIDSLGQPYDFKVVRSLGYGCDEEAIRLVREGPEWDVRHAQVPIGRVEIKF